MVPDIFKKKIFDKTNVCFINVLNKKKLKIKQSAATF